MPRAKYNHVQFIPKAYNFSNIQRGDDQDFDVENCVSESEIDDEVAEFGAEKMILSVLSSLDDREKVVFLCQIVRGDGFRIDHLGISQAMGISRALYMLLLNRVKTKAKYILQDK